MGISSSYSSVQMVLAICCAFGGVFAKPNPDVELTEITVNRTKQATNTDEVFRAVVKIMDVTRAIVGHTAPELSFLDSLKRAIPRGATHKATNM